MCNFFSCIVTRTGEVLFTEFESHEEVVSRSGLRDDLGYFVRIEYTRKRGYRIDEANIPEWYERVAAEAKRNVMATYKRVAPLWRRYTKAMLSALEVCETLRDTAREEYESAKRKGFEHKAAEERAWVKYMPVQDTAWDEYLSTKRSASEVYKHAIATVPGYLDQKVKEVSK